MHCISCTGIATTVDFCLTVQFFRTYFKLVSKSKLFVIFGAEHLHPTDSIKALNVICIKM